MTLSIALSTATVDATHYVPFAVQGGETSVGTIDVFRYLPGARKRIAELRGVTLAAGAAYGSLRVGIASDDTQPAVLGQDAYGYALLIAGSGAAATAQIYFGGAVVATHATAAPPAPGTTIGVQLNADGGTLTFYWGANTLSVAIDTTPARRWRFAVYAAAGAVTSATIFNAANTAGAYSYTYVAGADGWNDAPAYRINATLTEADLTEDARMRFQRALGYWMWGDSSYKAIALSVPIANASRGWDGWVTNCICDMNFALASENSTVMTAIADGPEVKDDGELVVNAAIAAAVSMDQPVRSPIIPLGTPNTSVVNTPYPLAFGTALSLPMVVLDSGNLKYAYAAPRWLPGFGANGTPKATAVRDKGYLLNPNATPPDWTQDGNGNITLARAAVGQPIVDVAIDTNPATGTADPSRVRNLFLALVFPAITAAVLPDIDTQCGYTGNLGIAFSQGPTKKQVAKDWCDSVCASFLPLRNGQLSYLRLIDPDTASPMLVLDVGTMLTDLLPSQDRANGLTTQGLGGRNYSPVTDFATDASMTPAVRQQLGGAYRFQATYVGPLAPMYEFARGAPAQAFLTSTQADTQAAIDYACGFYRKQRMFAKVDVPYDLIHELGNVYRLVYPAYGLSGGVNALVVGVDEDVIDGSMTLTFWYAQPYGT